jgi:hypothetical protein
MLGITLIYVTFFSTTTSKKLESSRYSLQVEKSLSTLGVDLIKRRVRLNLSWPGNTFALWVSFFRLG